MYESVVDFSCLGKCLKINKIIYQMIYVSFERDLLCKEVIRALLEFSWFNLRQCWLYNSCCWALMSLLSISRTWGYAL